MSTTWHPYEYDVATIDRQTVIMRRGGFADARRQLTWHRFLVVATERDGSIGHQVAEALRWASHARENPDHLVVVGESEWTIEHPIRERLDGSLIGCSLHRELTESEQMPARGEWIVKRKRDGWEWTEVTS